jgi:tetratricopeptide (TPR) repeat protein
MNSEFVEILIKLIAEQGKEAMLNPAKCKAFLADYTHGDYKKESHLLLQAIDVGVQKTIDTTGELEICKKQQIKILHEERFLDKEAAANVVETLALVLRGEKNRGASQGTVCSNCGKELQKEWKTCPYCSTVVANTNLNQQDAEVIREKAETFLDNKEYDVSIYVFSGLNYLEKKDYDAAIRDFTEAIRLDPNNAYSYNRRSYGYFKKKDYDTAIRDLTEAIRLDPNNTDFSKARADVYYSRGLSYLEKEDYDVAIGDFDNAIRLNPKNPKYYEGKAVAYNNRGNSYLYKKDYDAAIRDYTEAIRLNPKNVYAYDGRGNSYSFKKDYDAAIRDFSEAIRLDPNNADHYGNRGACYLQYGVIDRAVQDLEKALKLNPNKKELRQMLSIIQTKFGNANW